MRLVFLPLEDRKPATLLSWEAWNAHRPVERFCDTRHATMQTPWGRASWRVPAFLDPQGSLAAAMSLYSFSLVVEGQTLSAAGIGSFAVPKERRGQGIGQAFLRQIHDLLRSEGFQIAFLFTGIGPAFYQNFGYIPRPNLLTTLPFGDLSPASAPSPLSITRLSLSPEAPPTQEAIAALCSLEGNALASVPWYIRRSPELWSHRLHQTALLDAAFPEPPPPQRLFLVTSPSNSPSEPSSWTAFLRGFLSAPDTFLLQEFGFQPGEEASLLKMFHAIPSFLPEPPRLLSGLFPPSLVSGLSASLPPPVDDQKLMFLSLSSEVPFPLPSLPGLIWPSDWF